MTSIGDKIHARRKHLDLTQEELGAKVGVTKATINKYETSIVVNLRRPAYLMGWEDKSVTVSGTNNNVVNNSENVNINTILSQEEQELIRIYRSLTVKGRMEMLNNAFVLEENNK